MTHFRRASVLLVFLAALAAGTRAVARSRTPVPTLGSPRPAAEPFRPARPRLLGPEGEDLVELLAEDDVACVRSLVLAGCGGDEPAARAAWAVLVAEGSLHLGRDEAREAVGCFALARALVPDGRVSEAEHEARLRACTRALASGDLAVARAVVAGPALAGRADAAYLEGRALEASDRPGEALDSYRHSLRCSGRVPPPGDLSLLRDLARHALQEWRDLDGLRGVAAERGFRSFATAHFVVHDASLHEWRSAELAALEAVFVETAERLGLAPGDAAGACPVSLFAFESRDAFARARVTLSWGDACAAFYELGGELEFAVFAHHPERGERPLADTLRHELAHVLVAHHLGRTRLPPWLGEGAACFAEPERDRRLRRARLRATAACKGSTLDELVRLRHDDLDSEDAGIFYAQSAVLFEELVARAGGVDAALRVGLRASSVGLDRALRGSRLDPEALERAICPGRP